MANEPITTVIGNLTADPELRYVGSGIPVADFTVASTPRSYNRDTQQWDDGETLFLRCTVWRDYAENVADSLQKGMQVIVYGKLGQRRFTDKHGNDRTVVEMQVDEVGPTLRWSRAQVTRAPREGGFSGQAQAQVNSAPRGGSAQDSWSQPAQPQSQAQANDFGQAPF